MQLCYFFNIFLWSKIQKFKSKLLVFRRKAYIPLFTKVNSVKGKMKVKTNPEPQNQINKSGMENFLQSPSQTPQPKETQLNGEKMKVSNTQTIEAKPVSPQITKPTQKAKNDNNNKIEEIEKEIERIESMLELVRSFDLSMFNEIVYKKNLMFRLLMIRAKIYVLVKDPNSDKIVTVALNPPRWGGSSLRYLITNCSSNWCKIMEKSTQKGKVYSYVNAINNDETPQNDDDIFD